MEFKDKYGLNVAIIGASKDRDKYSNKAVRAFRDAEYHVYPINPKESEIEGLKCYKSLADIRDKIGFASLYMNPVTSLAIKLPDQLKAKWIEMIIINPGAESDELIDAIQAKGIQTQMICSITALGRDPNSM